MKKKLLITLFLIANTFTLFAQVPSNDECAGAIALTPSTTCSAISGTISNATTSTTTPSCNYYRDVFYKFVANAPTATVTVVGSVGLDPVVGTFSACGGTSINCIDGSNSGGTEVVNMTNLTVGSTYYIKVQHYYSTLPSTFTFTICVVSIPVTPVNNDCAGAIAITPSTTCVQTTGTVLNATASASIPSCRSNYTSDVYYKFVANAPTAQVNVVPLATLDPIVAVYSSCGGSSVNCTDVGASGGAESLSLTGLIVGNTYFVQVAKYGSSIVADPRFTICVISVPVTPVNNDCAGAIALTPSTTCVQTTGTVLNATASASIPSCRTSYTSDVYYKFVANAQTAQVNVVPLATLDPIVAVYSSCGGLSVNCTDVGASGGSESLSLTGLIVGNTYFVQVAKYGSSIVADPRFTICVISTPIVTVPANNTCAGAITLTPSTTCVQTTGTLLNATASASVPTCQSTYTSDVYYKFVANAATAQVNVVPLATLDPIIAVYSSCGGSTVGCTDANAGGGSESLSLTGLVVGNTYFIQVAKYGSASIPNPGFTICVISTPVVTAPSNNECAGAIALTPSPSYLPVTGTILNATTSSNSTSCTSFYDVFYKFVANATTATVTAVGSAGLDLKIGVFSSCVTNNIGCMDQDWTYGGTETVQLSGLTIGNTYYVAIGNYTSSVSSTFTFTVCVQSSSTTTATQSSAALSSISLYPNPTQNILNIENVSASTKVELIDMTGKTVFSENIDTDTQLNVSNYSAGVYVLKLSVDGVVENRRVVISK
jgi:hypothetical protein